ncbi:MAG: hypothetical protein JJT94_12670 [Bernardetiaceae bacterium]|nr:hypothetical protein [Bernardetiaceae bacterium]
MFGNKKFQVKRQEDRLRVTHRWFSTKYILFGFFAIIWNGSLVIWYSMAFMTFSYSYGRWVVMIMMIAMIVFPILHVLAGISLGYYTLCGFVNTTYIDITQQQLSISYRPLPWPGAMSIDTSTIEQIFVKEKRKTSNNNTYYVYELYYIDNNKHQLKLLDSDTLDGGIGRIRQLERDIEDFLGIEDRIVAEEYGAEEKMLAKKIDAEKQKSQPRASANERDVIKLTLYDLSQNDILDWQLSTWKVVREVQYDWENIESHRQVQISDKKNSHEFYIIKKGHIQSVFQESFVSLVRYFSDLEMQLQQENPPSSLSYENETYWRDYALRGNKFLLSESNQPFFPVKVWIYFNQNKDKMLRVENFDNFDFKLTHGIAQDVQGFTNLLPAGGG